MGKFQPETNTNTHRVQVTMVTLDITNVQMRNLPQAINNQVHITRFAWAKLGFRLCRNKVQITCLMVEPLIRRLDSKTFTSKLSLQVSLEWKTLLRVVKVTSFSLHQFCCKLETYVKTNTKFLHCRFQVQGQRHTPKRRADLLSSTRKVSRSLPRLSWTLCTSLATSLSLRGSVNLNFHKHNTTTFQLPVFSTKLLLLTVFSRTWLKL